MAESEEVLVRVKSASHPSCEDVEFSCDPKATSVRQVKEKIRTLYSFHPDIADQRLIYAGHLLDDVQLLTDVFGLSGSAGSLFSPQASFQHSGPYTIHLACTSKSYINPNQRSTRNDNLSSDTSQSRPFSSQIPNPMMQDPRLVGNMEGHPNLYEVNGNSGTPQVPPEFYALHQLYIEQMTAYMQSWNAAYGMGGMGSGYPYGGQVPFPVPNPQNLPNFNIPGNNNLPPQQQQPLRQPQNVPQPNEPAPRPQPENNLAGGLGGFFGGPAAAQGNDDEENQRDILDWAYTISRLVLILSVVYFYSNFTRFLLVVIFFIAIGMFQRRPIQLPAVRQRQNPRNRNGVGEGNPADGNPAPNNQNMNEPAPAPNNNENIQAEGVAAEPNNNANNNNAGEEGVAAAAAERTPEADAAAQAAEANVVAGGAQQGFAYYREVTWTFLTTFFTSLIPEMHQHNN